MQRNSVSISEKEVQLLRSPGSSLVDFNKLPETLFPDSKVLSYIAELQGIGTKRIKTIKAGPNSALRIFYFCTLKEMFSLRHYSNALTRRFKTLLYKETVNLQAIENVKEIKGINSRQMKKLIVEFLQLVSYSKEGSRVEICLDRYPIIDTLMLLFMRTLLIGEIPRVEDFHQEIGLLVSYPILASIFEINVTATDGYIQLFDSAYHIFQENKTMHLVFFEQKIVESICDSPMVSPCFDLPSLSSARKYHYEEATPFFEPPPASNSSQGRHFSFRFQQSEKGLFDRYVENNENYFLKDKEDKQTLQIFEDLENELENNQKSLRSTKKKIQKKNTMEQPIMVPDEVEMPTAERSPRKMSLDQSNATLPLFNSQGNPSDVLVIKRDKYQENQSSQQKDVFKHEETYPKVQSAIINVPEEAEQLLRDSFMKPFQAKTDRLPIRQSGFSEKITFKQARKDSDTIKSQFRVSFQYNQKTPLSKFGICSKPASPVPTKIEPKFQNQSLVLRSNGVCTPTKARTPHPSPTTGRPLNSSTMISPLVFNTASEIKGVGFPPQPMSRTSRSPRNLRTEGPRVPFVLQKKLQPVKVMNIIQHRYPVYRP